MKATKLARTTLAPALAIASTGGLRDRVAVDPRDGSPLAADALFNLGSIAKTFTAGVLACLVVDGAVHLDASIRTAVDEPWVPDVTFLALATHTSGLPRDGPKRSGERMVIDTPDALCMAITGSPIGRPGRYRYSNLGYLLLGHVIERISERPLPTLTAELLFGPLRMTDTFHTSNLDRRPLTGVRVDNGQPTSDRRTIPGAGGFYGTVDDLLRWVSAVSRPRDSHRNVMDTMTQPRVRLGPFTAVPESWNRPARPGTRHIGLAWRIEHDGLTWHTGGTAGFTTFCATNRQTGNSTVALLAAGIGALPDSPTTIPHLLTMLRLREQLARLARS